MLTGVREHPRNWLYTPQLAVERISGPGEGHGIQGVDPVLRVRNQAIVRSRGRHAGTIRDRSHFELSNN